jgi:hypothetical protein
MGAAPMPSSPASSFNHFSARFEPEPVPGERNNGGNRSIVGNKLQENCEFPEQNAVVAPRSQLQAIHLLPFAAKQPNWRHVV